MTVVATSSQWQWGAVAGLKDLGEVANGFGVSAGIQGSRSQAKEPL